MPATVPGAVQLDWARAHNLPDINHGQNVRAYDGLEDSFWLYRTRVPVTPETPGQRLFLRGGGVDYHAEIRVGGESRLTTTGLSSPFELDLTGTPADTPVEILVHPAPKRSSAPADRAQASHVTKPAVSYGWDWHPRLIPLGLCEDVRFESRPAVHLRHVDFDCVLADDFSFADIVVTVETSVPVAATWRLRDPDGRIVIETTTANARLDRPRLWWTHDHGEPALYRLEVELASGDRLERKVGLRRVRLVMHEGAWSLYPGFPKSRSNPPITVELNGRPIFVKGSNWVNPDLFPGRVDAATYGPLLTLARDAHFNLLRCWGGAPAAKESFFEQCDELGILVWQEFPLACNLYPDTRDYLRQLDLESRALIRRLRQHPCLALWCGGNELFNSWSGMTDQSLPLRLLNSNCYALDPHTPFIPTAPVDGMGHGDYRFLDEHGRDIFQIFQRAANTAYSEFGCAGPSSAAYIKAIIPEAELWPPRPGTSWETHHAFGAWDLDPTSWLSTRTIEHYFGTFASLEELVTLGEWLQSEGYKSVFEEARRQAPRCSMALNWCYNEPWPSAANNSIVNWPTEPKAAYFAVRDACRPVLASARIPKFQWTEGEEFSAELWLLNDTPASVPAGEVLAELAYDDLTIELVRWRFPGIAAQTNLAGPSVRARLPALGNNRAFTLRLTVSGLAGLDSTYRLSLRAVADVVRHTLNH
jgi:beta-mannosidase